MKQLSIHNKIQIALGFLIFLMNVVSYVLYLSLDNPGYPLYLLIGWAFLSVSIGYPRPHSKWPKADIISLICLLLGTIIIAFHMGRVWI